MDQRHPWLRVAFVLLFLLGTGKALRDLHREADHADEPNHELASGALFDYRDTAFNPSRDLLDGRNPYDHVDYMRRHPGTQEFDAYLPSWFVFAVPLSLPPYLVGQTLWWCTLMGGIAALAWLSLRAANLAVDPWRVLGLTGALLLSLPGSQVMRSGQQAFAFACCVLVVALWPERWRWGSAVALLVLASKPQFIAPVVVLLLFRRYLWPVLGRGVVLIALATLPPLVALVSAAGGVGAWVDSVRANLDYSSQVQNDLSTASQNIRVDALNTLGKLDLVKATTAWQLGLAVVVLAIAVLALQRAAEGSALLLVLVTTAVLVSFPHYRYDLAVTVPALVVVLAGARGADRLAPAVRWALVALLLVPLLQVFQVDGVLDRAGLPDGLHQSIASLCTTAAFLVAAAATLVSDPARGRGAVEDEARTRRS